MPLENTDTPQGSAILKELSDIKASLAVNTNETANIKSSMTEIKGDIKDIKNDFVSRREFTEALKEVRGQISPIKKVVYTLISAMGLAVLGAIFKLILK
jgi:hypothetical protein